MRVFVWTLALGVTFAIASSPALATEVTLTPIKDTYVQSINPGTNFGQSDELWLGKGSYFGLGIIRGLVEFDLSSLPSDPSLIDSAIFSSYQFNTEPAAGGIDTRVHRITSAWGEDTATWNSQPSFDGYVWASAPVGDSFYTGWIDWDVTDLVRAQADGTYSNLGWMFKVQYETAGVSRLGYFHSAEYNVDPSLRPRLVVDVIPEPAAFGLLALGGLILARRQR